MRVWFLARADVLDFCWRGPPAVRVSPYSSNEKPPSVGTTRLVVAIRFAELTHNPEPIARLPGL
jgi:hypothetical protein